MGKPQYINLEINELHVNKNNYRHEPKKTENEAISYFFEKKNDINALLRLCKSFIDNGYYPDSAFLICKNDNNEYYALDGNRRLTCLKILENPSLIPNTSICKSLKNFVDKNYHTFEKPTLSCYLYENEQDASERIRMLHSNSTHLDQRWTQIQQYRFDSSHGIKVPLWFNIIESNDPSLFDQTKNTSTLERIVINKYVDIFLPINYSTYKFLDNKSFYYFKQIIADVSSGSITSRAVNTATEIQNYLNRVIYKNKNDTKASTNSINNDDNHSQEDIIKNDVSKNKKEEGLETPVTSNTDTPNEKSEKQEKQKHIKSTKKSKFLKDLNTSGISNISLRYTGLIDIITEIKTIDYKRFPIAAAMLSRTLLDQSLRYFAEQHNLPKRVTFNVTGTGINETIKGEIGLEKMIKNYNNCFNNPKYNQLFSIEFKKSYTLLFNTGSNEDIKNSNIKMVFDYSVHHPHVTHANYQELENFSNNGLLFFINYLLNN